jgi:phosphomannomutase
MDQLGKLKISISGVRGLCPEDLDQAAAYAFTRSYCDLIGSGQVVVSRDSRATGKDLKRAVLQALSDAGREIYDADIIPLPTTQVAITHCQAAGGIDITASHNPAEYNGLKFLDADGTFLHSDQVEQLRSGFTRYYDADAKFGDEEVSVKTIRNEAIRWHLDEITPHTIEGKKLLVAVDAVNGAGSEIVPKFLESIGCEVIHIATDPTQPFPHTPEPRPENLVWTQEQLQGKQFDVCVYTDPDADRLAILDETGQVVSEECILPLVAQELVAAGHTGIVVINQMTSQMTEAVFASNPDVTVTRSMVGEVHLVHMMKDTEAFFGGEGCGGLIDPDVHYGRDALVGIVYIINALRRTGKTISQLVAELPQFYLLKEKISTKDLADLEALYGAVQDHYADQSGIVVDRRDGLRLSWEDTWIHMRPSNTEPIVRIYIETPSKEEATGHFTVINDILSNL